MWHGCWIPAFAGMTVIVLFSLIVSPSLSAGEISKPLLTTTTPQADLTLVDPEFANQPLPKLVLPPEPPPRVRLPELVVKSDEWKGVQCGVTESRFAVFRHTDKWQLFWERALAPLSHRLAKTPQVDFDKDMVVGVFMGEKPYPHYEIEIRSISEENRPETGKVLVVRYREIKKMMGVFVPPFAVQPFHLKKVPAYGGSVVFQKVRR
jgi:hypothetical protein